MKRLNQALWGIILVCVGLVLCLNALGITRIDVFFDGWWTLFIIVPSFVGVLTGKDKTGSLIGLCIGVFLLLCCWNILDFGILWKLLLPVIILLFGAKMIFESFFNTIIFILRGSNEIRGHSGQSLGYRGDGRIHCNHLLHRTSYHHDILDLLP